MFLAFFVSITRFCSTELDFLVVLDTRFTYVSMADGLNNKINIRLRGIPLTVSILSGLCLSHCKTSSEIPTWKGDNLFQTLSRQGLLIFRNELPHLS